MSDIPTLDELVERVYRERDQYLRFGRGSHRVREDLAAAGIPELLVRLTEADKALRRIARVRVRGLG